jgi:dTDP-4-dehydrorhamnose reductase
VRVAVTGARGRLGRALIDALEEAPFTGPLGPIAWSRPELDLDTLDEPAAVRLIARDRPEVVVHAAAWTDVEGCARDPVRAERRNGAATASLAAACASHGVELVLVSTNEVFGADRSDGRGHRPNDPPSPMNPYASSKLTAETGAVGAFLGAAGVAPIGRPAETGRLGPSAGRAPSGSAGPTSGPAPGAGPAPSGSAARLAIVRTAWLYGPPGNDFPAKILAAAERARSTGEALRVVGDEVGSPTYAPDLAEAIAELIGLDALAPTGEVIGIHHLVNRGSASRAEWAREILAATGVRIEVQEVPAATWTRASIAPRWAVLEPTELPSGEPMRPWREAFAEYVPHLVRSRR